MTRLRDRLRGRRAGGPDERSPRGRPAWPRSRGRWARRYADLTVRGRWVIVLGWAAGLLALVLMPAVGTGGDQLASVIPLDSPALKAEARSVQAFGFPLSSRTVVVQRDPDGLSVWTQAESVLDAIAVDQSPPHPPLLGALPLTNTVRLGRGADETNTSVLTYLFMKPGSSFASQRESALEYIDANLDHPTDHVVGVAGSVPARAEQAGIVSTYLPRLELLTVLAIVLIVGLTFRSVVAPLIALAASAVAFLVTIHLSAVIGGALGVSTPAELEPLLVALLLGVVTDYTIFYLTALQTRVRQSGDWREAVRAAVASYSPIILVAGITVAAGTASLLAATSEFFRGLGPAMALAVVVGLAVSVTLVPALLAILGPWAFWPRPRRSLPQTRVGGADDAGGPRGRVLALLTRRWVAAPVLLLCVGGLVTASLSLRHVDLGVGFTSSLPRDNPVAQASRAAAKAFSPGITSPTTVLVEGHGVGTEAGALARLQQRVADQPGVASVIGPAQNFTRRNLGVVMSRSGDAARMLVVLDTDPLDATAIGNVARLRQRLPGLAQEAGLGDARISVAGDSALAEGLVSSTTADLGRIAVAAVLVNLLLLVLFLRALVAPVLLLASSVLALTASLGLTVTTFMDLGGTEGLTFYVPFAAAVLLVSLGSDYNIFGVGRVWDEAARLPLREAIRTAMPESTRAISTAGLTLAVSFGMLAIIPLTPFREIAFAMAVGIALDVLVVRSVLVPCLLTLAGAASGWPGPHLRAELAGSRPGTGQAQAPPA